MKRLHAAALGIAAALPLMVYLWGFMVDDALITARYAANLAAGHGHRFNPGGPITDGVTPLGFAHLLAPFAADGPFAAFAVAKWMGAALWLAGAAAVGVAIDRIEGAQTKWLGLLLVATSAPLGAWSVSGMETGIVTGLAAIAAASRVLGRERTCALTAGLVAAWRPEAIPWAVALALGPSPNEAAPSRWARLGASVAPALVVAAVRLALFGRTMPLAAIAKPPSPEHGAMYALACAILCGPVALLAVRRLPRWVHGLQAAVLAHWVAMALAGGDWMPVSRLATTALPTLAIAAAATFARAPGPRPRLDRAWLAVRLAAALGGQMFVIARQGANLADTTSQRMAVVEAFRDQLDGASVVAALDVGWVGATTPATVVDLAGVTDPEVAILPGGHTSKRIPRWFFDARDVDTIVLRLRRGESLQDPFYTSRFATFVDMWAATTPNVAESFEVVQRHDEEPRYILLRRTTR